MGKLNIFEITILNNPQAVYYAGQMMEGHITVELNAPMTMRGIYLKLHGKGYVHWTETHSTGSGKNRRTTTRHYSATEIYFDHKFSCFGKPDPGMGGDNPELPAGRHVFPFKYQLPINLPSSFEGAWGYVRYSLKANIDKPWKFDHTTKKLFTVICLLDLNQDPNAAQPAQGNNSKTLCCMCCESGPITANVSLDRRGYVPGESILLNAEVNNGSNTVMDCSRVKITMIFHATSKSRTQHQNVVKLQKEPIPAGETYYWNQEKIPVPPVPPSYLVHCNIIDIRYVLQFEVDPSGPSFDLEVPLDIIIGTIPLHHVVAQYPGMSGYAAQPQSLPSPFPPAGPSAPSAEAFPSQPAASPSAPSLPPPAYSECVFGKVNTRDDDDSEHTMGDREYAPVYPYYNWDSIGQLFNRTLQKNH